MRRICAPIALLLATLAGALSAAPPLAEAQPSEQIGSDKIRLSEVLSVVVQRSPALASAQLNTSIAEAQVIQSTGIDDLLVQATGSYLVDANENVQGNITGTDRSNVISVSSSISQLLSTGGTMSVQASGTRRAFTLTFDGSEVATEQLQLSARFNQPLLRGRGKEISHASQVQARNNLGAVAFDLQATARDEVRGVIEAYWEVVWAQNDLEIRRSALALAAERRRLTESSVKLGSAPRTALLEVDQVLATNEEEILLAEQRVTERSLDLRRVAGLEIGPGHINIATEEQLSVAPKPYTLETVLETALASSPELAALEKRGENATISIKVATNNAGARLDFGLSAGPQGTDDSLAGAASRLAQFKGYFVGADLTYEQRIGNNQGKGSRLDAQTGPGPAGQHGHGHGHMGVFVNFISRDITGGDA